MGLRFTMRRSQRTLSNSKSSTRMYSLLPNNKWCIHRYDTIFVLFKCNKIRKCFMHYLENKRIPMDNFNKLNKPLNNFNLDNH